MPKFQPGNKFGKGGARKNSGPAPNWLKELATDLLKKHKLIEYAADVARGEQIEDHAQVTVTGKLVRYKTAADTPVRLKAVEFITNRAEGLPKQLTEHEGIPGIDLVSLIRQAEDEGGMERTV